MNQANTKMKDPHVNDRLLQFADQSLPPPDRQLVGEHLLHCEACQSVSGLGLKPFHLVVVSKCGVLGLNAVRA